MLLPLLAWAPVGGEMAYMRAPCPILLRLWEHAACERLRDAFDDAFGGMPDGLVIRPVVARGAPGPVLVGIADRPDDLLVVGGGGWGRLASAVHGSASRYCLAHARCPVLAVPPPDLIRELRSRRHHWRPEDFASPWPADKLMQASADVDRLSGRSAARGGGHRPRRTGTTCST